MNRAAVIALTLVIVTTVAAADTDPPPPADPAAPPPSDATAPVTPTPTPAPAPVKQVVVVEGMVIRSGTTFDLTVSGGLKLWSGSRRSEPLGVRADPRQGVMRYSEPAFLMAWIAAQYGEIQ